MKIENRCKIWNINEIYNLSKNSASWNQLLSKLRSMINKAWLLNVMLGHLRRNISNNWSSDWPIYKLGMSHDVLNLSGGLDEMGYWRRHKLANLSIDWICLRVLNVGHFGIRSVVLWLCWQIMMNNLNSRNYKFGLLLMTRSHDFINYLLNF